MPFHSPTTAIAPKCLYLNGGGEYVEVDDDLAPCLFKALAIYAPCWEATYDHIQYINIHSVYASQKYTYMCNV